MLDAPFYAASLVRTRIDGEDTCGVHEALDLGRFRSPLAEADAGGAGAAAGGLELSRLGRRAGLCRQIE